LTRTHVVIDLSPVVPTQARMLAARHGLGARHYEIMFKKLTTSRILASQRGKFGGYRLRRGLRQITVADVAAALNDDAPAPGAGEIIESAVRASLATITAGPVASGSAKEKRSRSMPFRIVRMRRLGIPWSPARRALSREMQTKASVKLAANLTSNRCRPESSTP
jgi:DNA-binding IscR family transcriptional regulator